MAKVFHSDSFDKIIEKMDMSRLGRNVAVKVHFGEKGCTTYLRPELAKQVCDKITASGRKATLVECNVLYVSPRTRADTHKQVALEHGFDFAPIHILDGKKGNNSVDLDGCRIGEGIKEYDSMVVLTHFKGHMVGFGGAVKNLGMGLGSRAGKLDMHAGVHPLISTDKCISCGRCVKNCPADAISFNSGNKAEIDPDKCIGCAMCISVCPEKAVGIPWGGRDEDSLQKRMRDYAQAILDHLGPEHFVFINIMENITPGCDCMAVAQEPMMPDKGYAISNDIDAIDLACLEITDNLNGKAGENHQNKKVNYEIEKL